MAVQGQQSAAGTFVVTNKSIRMPVTGNGSVTIEAASGGTGVVSYSLVNAPAGFSIAGRVITITPSASLGVRTIIARATWTQGASTTFVDQTFTITITIPTGIKQFDNLTTEDTAGFTTAFTNNAQLTGWVGNPTAFTDHVITRGQATLALIYALGFPCARTPQLAYIKIARRSGGTGSPWTVCGGSTGTAGNGGDGISEIVYKDNTTGEARYYTRSSRAGVSSVGLAGYSRNTSDTRFRYPSVAQAGTFTPGVAALAPVGSEDATFTFVEATGGAGTITYSLVNPPRGMTLSGRTVTVGAQVPAGSSSLTIRATWTLGGRTAAVDATINVVIARTAVATAGSFSVNNQVLSLAQGGAGTFSFDAATGGVGIISYSLVNAPSTYAICERHVFVTGSATTATITIRATWSLGNTVAHTDTEVTVTINRIDTTARATLCELTDIIIPVGTDTSSFVLPGITNGGLNPWTYSVTGLPAGVTFGSSDRTLRVSTDAGAGTFNLVYKAVQGSAEYEQRFTLGLVEATVPEVPDEPTEPTGQAIPPGALIKCIPAPVEYPRAQGTNYKLFINGRFVGLGSD